MLKTTIAILVAVLVILITVVVIVGGLFLLIGAALRLWAHYSDSQAAKQPGKINRTGESALTRYPFQVHQSAVTAVSTIPGIDSVLTAGRDRTWRVCEADTSSTVTATIPFYPGPIAVGTSATGETFVASGRFDAEPDHNTEASDLAIWRIDEPGAPWREWQVSQLHRIIGVAFNPDATELRTLVSIDEPENDFLTVHLAVLVYDLVRNLAPRRIAIPATGLRLDDLHLAAFSINGSYVACRTTHTAGDGATYHGVGVWDITAQTWEHRFGGREAQAHKIYAITQNGNTVFTSREDSPGRDCHIGGPEWYDGLYIWNESSPPEGTEEAKPHAMHGSSNMVFSADESLFADTSASGNVDVFRWREHKSINSFHLPRAPQSNGEENTWCAAFTTNNKQLVTGHANGQVCWWTL